MATTRQLWYLEMFGCIPYDGQITHDTAEEADAWEALAPLASALSAEGMKELADYARSLLARERGAL